jgi:SHS family lactate transporter-like MFS transporter
METVPERARAVASSLMMAGYEFGFLAAAGAQAVLLPMFGWRSLFFVGVAPALLAIFIRRGIGESPVWLRLQEQRSAPTYRPRSRRRFRMDAAAWQACIVMAVLQFQNAAMYSFYPSLLKTVHHYGDTGVFYAVAAYAIGSILGKPTCGALATRIGNRATLLIYLVITVADIVPFVASTRAPILLAASFVMGAFGNSVFALVPHYLSLRFHSAVRSFGMGVAYALAAAGQGVAGYVVPALGHGIGLERAIEILVVAGSIAVALATFREPAHLPGNTMDEAPDAPTSARPAGAVA